MVKKFDSEGGGPRSNPTRNGVEKKERGRKSTANGPRTTAGWTTGEKDTWPDRHLDGR